MFKQEFERVEAATWTYSNEVPCQSAVVEPPVGAGQKLGELYLEKE